MYVSGIFEFSMGGVRAKFDINGSENEKKVYYVDFTFFATVIHNTSVFSVILEHKSKTTKSVYY
jgi:hypothetical protein